MIDKRQLDHLHGVFCFGINLISRQRTAYLSSQIFSRYRETTFGCGGRILLSANQPDFDISSPNYPNVPPPHAECVWVIVAPAGKRIQIDFLERFDVKPSRR